MKTMQHLGAAVLLLLALSLPAQGQNIDAKLGGSGSADYFRVTDSAAAPNSLFRVQGDGKVAIGPDAPAFKLSLSGDGGILATGTLSAGDTLPVIGDGARLIWYPRKAAFRAGYGYDHRWDNISIGLHSTAMGGFTTASGPFSTAMGSGTKSDGDCSTAMGNGTTASNQFSTAMGYQTISSGQASTAMGWSTAASGAFSTAMGHSTDAIGNYSTAMGFSSAAIGASSTAMGSTTVASGGSSTAMGDNTIASGLYSTAMGFHSSTNLRRGAFVIGDGYCPSSAYTVSADTTDTFTARFRYGYKLYTNTTMTTGVQLGASGSSWSSISDSTKKTAFHAVDSEDLLSRFGALRLGSWNYKGDMSPQRRHYGPMAQEWFAAFGRDGIGTIGDDTTLASADVDGVLCIAVQALEKRTSEQRAVIDRQERQIGELQGRIDSMKSELAELRQLRAAVERLSERMNANGAVSLTSNR